MIVAVAHNKGGVGKTTTVVQLAGELKPEIIIDLDAHQGIAIINGRRPVEQRWDVRAGLDKAALIKLLKAAGDHLVLIDCGGFDSELVRIAIAAADLIIAPSNDEITEQIGLVRFNQGYCAQFTDKFHENYFSYIIHIDSGLESNVSAYHRRSVPSSHAFASTLQLHKSASRCISDSS